MDVYSPAVKLRSLVGSEGGVSVADAIANANSAIDAMRPQALSRIDRMIDQLARLFARRGAAAASELYDRANDLYGCAGAFDLTEVSDVAYNLCRLLSSSVTDGDRTLIQLHMDALRSLRRTDMGGGEVDRSSVLGFLKNLVDRRIAPSGQPDGGETGAG